jgi:hypothetical protein
METLIAPLTNPRPLSIRPLPFYPDCLSTALSEEAQSHEPPSTSSHFDLCLFTHVLAL